MAKKKMSTQAKILTGLSFATVALFSYQNIYVPNVVLDREAVVFVAKADIPAYTEVEVGMFDAVPVAERSVINGSVRDINSVAGQQISGSLKKGELLSEARLTTEEVPEGELLSEVKITSRLPLEDNDNIRVFVKSQGEGNLFTVEQLFESKKVFTKDTIMGIPEDGSQQTQATEGMQFYLKLNQQEVLKYEEAISTGTIVAVKIIDDEEVAESVTSESQTKLVSDKQPIQEKSNRGTVQYTVKEGENMASVAEKFVTSENSISEMNDGMTKVEAGDTILVPAI